MARKTDTDRSRSAEGDGLRAWYRSVERRGATLSRKYADPFTRVAFGVVFIWLGA